MSQAKETARGDGPAAQVIRAGRVLTPQQEYAPGALLVVGERIAAVGPAGSIAVPAGAAVAEYPDKLVIPGLVDTHIHGGDGRLFGDSVEAAAHLLRLAARTGTTSLLPTLGGERSAEALAARIRVVRAAMQAETAGAEIVGIHLEGPFLSGAETARGTTDLECLRLPTLDELHRLMEAAEGALRKVSIAPELEGALPVIAELARNGVVASAAHSAATYEQVMAAVEAGLSCATHTFNGMIPLHHRNPGLVGAVLTCDRIHAELIGDGEHVSPVAMQVLLRCKGTAGVHLVSDNTVYAGMPNGAYPRSGGRTVVKEDHRVYVVGGTLAGSVAPLSYDVANVARTAGCSLGNAVRMAALNPARLIGVAGRKGSLEPGKDADLVVVDDEMRVCLTMVRGRVVYRAGGMELP